MEGFGPVGMQVGQMKTSRVRTRSEENALPRLPMNGNGASYAKKLPEPKQVFVVDFFCGCGGLSYAFANTRQSHIAYKILAGIDIDRVALQTYHANVGAPGLYADIGNIGENPKLLSALVPDFDPQGCRPLVFIGCAPCQGFSAHRKKDLRDDPRNSLLVGFAKIT